MTLDATLSPTGGTLTIKPGDVPALDPLFAGVLATGPATQKPAPLVLNPAVLSPASTAGQQTLTGTTTAWGGTNAQIVITFSDAYVETIHLTRQNPNALALRQLGLRLTALTDAIDATRPNPAWDDLSFAMSSTASVSIAGKDASVTVTPSGDSRLRLTFTLGKHGFGLDDLVCLIHTDADPAGDLRWLPDELRKLADLRVVDLDLTLSLAGGFSVDRAGLNLSFGSARWPVFPGLDFPTVGAIKAELAIDHPLDPNLRVAEITLSGEILIEQTGAPILVSAAWPDLRLRGALPQGGTINLTKAAAALGITSKGLSDSLVLTDFEIAGRPIGKRKSFSIAAAVASSAAASGDSQWAIPIGGKQLALKNISFSANWQADSGHSGQIMATGLFQPRPATPAQAPAQPAVPAGRPSSELTVMASENNGAWTFGARWHADANAGMNVGDWFADFAHGLDSGIELPTFLKQLSVGAIDFSFDTGADRLAVGISATAGDPNAPKPDDITLDLALTAAPDIGGKDWKIEASGVLTRGDLTFSLTLDRGDGTRLIAMLQADPPVKATLDDLAQALGFGTGTTWPQVWLNFIAAVAVSDAPAGAGAPLPVQLVAVDLDLGIDLANLPLIGKLLTALGGFSLAFQLSYASRKLDPSAADAALVEAVNARLPPGATALPKPEQIGASLNLAAVLKVGEAQTRLALPIKADQATGNVVVDPAAAPQPPPSADGITWKTLNAQLGPITLARVGGRFDMGDATAVPRTDPSLTLLLDASVAMGPVAFAFKGLGVKATLQGTAVTAAFQIDGLGIDYRGGGVHISGALLPQGAEDFAGTALIATDAFSLTAVAAYTSAEGRKSLFVYGVLDKAIGGPAFFFVTGLAAGFGYNRTVVFPDIDHVADFPLIALAVPGTRKPGELTDEMATLRQSVPVAWDEYFLAAGIKFNSFKLIDSFVLLVVRFGDDLEFDLLGLSTAVLPPAVVGDTVAPIAKIQAAIKASYRPDEGVLRVQAQLTDASFLFDRKCQLRGGFAFYAWLKDQPGVAEAGDFVATIGGYHPRFDLGAHPGYPNVPRLSIDWPVSDALQIKADCYCALTPVAIMAGGHLSVSYQQDSIKAWFNAGFDFIMFWKPFHYTGHAYVDIGGSYTFNFFVEHTISIEVGATLDVSGPDFACAAHVSLYVVSFDVNYGVLNQMPDWLTWDKFVQAFLPETDLVRVSLAQGQLQQADQGGPAAVDATTLRIDCDSALPATALSYDNISYVLDLKTSAAVALAPGTAPTPLGVVPMGPGLGSYQATHQVTITYRPDPANPANATSAIDDFNWLPRLKQAPTALWGKPTNDSNDMLAQSNGVVAAYGITLTPKPAKAGSSTSPRDMSKLVDVVKAAATTCKMAKEDQATVIPAPRNWDGSVQAPGALDDAVISHADLRAALVDGFGFDPALDRPRAGFAAALRMPPLWRTDQVTVQ